MSAVSLRGVDKGWQVNVYNCLEIKRKWRLMFCCQRRYDGHFLFLTFITACFVLKRWVTVVLPSHSFTWQMRGFSWIFFSRIKKFYKKTQSIRNPKKRLESYNTLKPGGVILKGGLNSSISPGFVLLVKKKKSFILEVWFDVGVLC